MVRWSVWNVAKSVGGSVSGRRPSTDGRSSCVQVNHVTGRNTRAPRLHERVVGRPLQRRLVKRRRRVSASALRRRRFASRHPTTTFTLVKFLSSRLDRVFTGTRSTTSRRRMPSPTKNARRTVPDLLLAAANEANDDGNYARAYALFDAAFQLLPALVRKSVEHAAQARPRVARARGVRRDPVSQLSEKAAALVARKRGEAQQAVAGGKDIADPPSFSVDEVLMRGGQQANASGDTQLARRRVPRVRRRARKAERGEHAAEARRRAGRHRRVLGARHRRARRCGGGAASEAGGGGTSRRALSRA